jgi:hypothetical protein
MAVCIKIWYDCYMYYTFTISITKRFIMNAILYPDTVFHLPCLPITRWRLQDEGFRPISQPKAIICYHSLIRVYILYFHCTGRLENAKLHIWCPRYLNDKSIYNNCAAIWISAFSLAVLSRIMSVLQSSSLHRKWTPKSRWCPRYLNHDKSNTITVLPSVFSRSLLRYEVSSSN